MKDRPRHGFRRIDRRRVLGSPVGVIGSMVLVRRVDGGRLDQGDRHRRPRLFQLHTQSIGIAQYRRLRGAVDTLHGDGTLRKYAADVDQLAATLAQVLAGHQRTVNHAPEVGIEQTSLILQRDILQIAVNRRSGVVDPGVEATEVRHGSLGQPAYVRLAADIGDRVDGVASLLAQFGHQLGQRLFAARSQRQPCPPSSGQPRRDQTDTRGRSGKHDDLFVQSLQLHATSLACRLVLAAVPVHASTAKPCYCSS